MTLGPKLHLKHHPSTMPLHLLLWAGFVWAFSVRSLSLLNGQKQNPHLPLRKIGCNAIMVSCIPSVSHHVYSFSIFLFSHLITHHISIFFFFSYFSPFFLYFSQLGRAIVQNPTMMSR